MFRKKYTTCYVIRVMPFDILIHMTQEEYEKFEANYPALFNGVKRIGSFWTKDKRDGIDAEHLAYIIKLNLASEM